MELVFENLSLVRGARLLIDRLDLRLTAGEALVLVGPNGSGKTTLIRAIAGFFEPASGAIRFQGGDPEAPLAEQCHYVGHLNGLKSSLSVGENLAFWFEYLGGGGTAALEDALDRFGLAPIRDVPAGYLSAGQRRRLALARLLVASRPLWLLDEPTASLDAEATGLVARLLEEHLEGGGLVVVATHHPLGLSRSKELRLGVEGRPA